MSDRSVALIRAVAMAFGALIFLYVWSRPRMRKTLRWGKDERAPSWSPISFALFLAMLLSGATFHVLEAYGRHPSWGRLFLGVWAVFWLIGAPAVDAYRAKGLRGR